MSLDGDKNTLISALAPASDKANALYIGIRNRSAGNEVNDRQGVNVYLFPKWRRVAYDSEVVFIVISFADFAL